MRDKNLISISYIELHFKMSASNKWPDNRLLVKTYLSWFSPYLHKYTNTQKSLSPKFSVKTVQFSIDDTVPHNSTLLLLSFDNFYIITNFIKFLVNIFSSYCIVCVRVRMKHNCVPYGLILLITMTMMCLSISLHFSERMKDDVV